MRLSINVLVNGALWSLNLSSLDSCLQLVLSRLHQWRVESTTYLQHQCTLSTSSLQALASLLDSLNVTADNQLSRTVIVSGYYYTLTQLANLGANLLYSLIGQSNDSSHS